MEIKNGYYITKQTLKTYGKEPVFIHWYLDGELREWDDVLARYCRDSLPLESFIRNVENGIYRYSPYPVRRQNAVKRHRRPETDLRKRELTFD